MADFLTRLFYLRSLLALSLLIGGAQVWADVNNINVTAAKAERIAPALNSLARSFKPDSSSEAQVILRKTHVYIDAQLMSHATPTWRSTSIAMKRCATTAKSA